MFAITAASLLAVVGLLYSFGVVLAQRRALQTAADAACLGGTWQVLTELASDNRSDAAVMAEVVHFATANGAPSDGTSSDATYLAAVYVDGTGTPLSPTANVGVGGAFSVAARGVRVTVNSQVPTVLPGFLRVWQLLVQDSATAAARPTVPAASATLVVPVAANVSDAQSAFARHAVYDLFAYPLPGGQQPTLDLAASGAPSFGATSTNVQYWSDGQHATSWQLTQPRIVNLADHAYFDSVAAGLRDNVRRQGLVDASGAAYALVTVPVYDSSTPTTVHIVGFAQMKLRAADISASNARGTFAPYAVAAWGTPVAPTPDVGAALVGIVS